MSKEVLEILVNNPCINYLEEELKYKYEEINLRMNYSKIILDTRILIRKIYQGRYLNIVLG